MGSTFHFPTHSYHMPSHLKALTQSHFDCSELYLSIYICEIYNYVLHIRLIQQCVSLIRGKFWLESLRMIACDSTSLEQAKGGPALVK